MSGHAHSWLVKVEMEYPAEVRDLSWDAAGIITWMRDDVEFDKEADARRFFDAMRKAYPCVQWSLYQQTELPKWERVA